MSSKGLPPLVLEMAPDIKQKLVFFQEQGAESSLNSLMQRMGVETLIFQKLLSKSTEVIIDYSPNLHDTNQLIEAINTAKFGNFDSFLEFGMYTDSYDYLKKLKLKGYYFNAVTFIKLSFINFLLADILAKKNIPLVENYLQSIGFKNVPIKRKTCEFNNRKNVWMIEAVK